jgi:hypothetical protein
VSRHDGRGPDDHEPFGPDGDDPTGVDPDSVDPDAPWAAPGAEDPLGALRDGDLTLAAHRLTARITLIGALVLHLMVGALLPTTPQLAPPWGLPVFATLWFVTAALILRWYRTRAITALLLPIALVGIWLATLWAGANLFGWGG